MNRTTLAFLLAPMWVPAATAVYSIDAFPHPEQRPWIYITICIAAIFTYGGVLTLGIPAFYVLRAREHTTFWIAPVVGFCVGVVTGLVFSVLFALSLGSSFTFIWGELTTNCRVDGDVGVPIPRRPGRADFPHPVLHDRGSLSGAYRWEILGEGNGWRFNISLRRAQLNTC
jgi:hypothetical protein